MDQGDGGYLKHCNAMIMSLISDRSMLKLEFVVPNGQHIPNPNDVMVDEDFFADLLGQFTLATAFARLRRGLHCMRGWPYRMVLY